MGSFIIILVSIIVLVVSTYLFNKISPTLDITKINMIALTFYVLIIFSFIGSVLIALGIDNHYMAKYIKHSETRIIGWSIVQAVMILMPLSMLLIKKTLKVKDQEFFDYLATNPKNISSNSDSEVFLIVTILSIVSVLSIGYTFYVIGLENNPIINMILGASSDKLARLRILAGREFTGNVYIRNIFAITMTPFLSYIAYIYLRIKRNKKWFVLFSILFISSLIITFYDLQKAQILNYFLTLIVINIYMGDKIKLKQLFIYASIAGIVIVLMYIFISGESISRILSFNSGPLNRIFLTQSMSIFLHYEVFTYIHPLLLGASFPSIISESLLGLEYERSARVVMETLRPDFVEQGIVGVYNGLFAGEAYANFSWIGIIFSIVYVGIFIYIMYIVFLRIKKTPVTIALYAYFTILYRKTIHGGFVDFIFRPIAIFIVLLCIGIVISSKYIRKYFNFS